MAEDKEVYYDGMIHLADLFEPEMLQRIQDAFSAMTGIAIVTTDENGIPVTKGSNFTEFCSKCRSTPIGAFRCEQCDVEGAHKALKKGAAVSYSCHAGMVDFAAPIMANDKMIGCFVGGQVRTSPPDIATVLQVAREIGVDAIGFLQASLSVPIMNQEDIDKAASALYTIADVISSITYHKYIMHQANIEIEKAARMKSDFLANMSHEIRTPMNAVIGMAEMALREDMSPDARDYITQIKTSGKTLLTIINDILDFSKIESGKMTIIPTEYEPMSIINDVNNIIMTRIGKKDVELIIDVTPDLPCELIGDAVRIKQIITNISNNAVKFTEVGQVKLTIDYEQISENKINLLLSVMDTGIGIKKDDMNKLFQSFQQIDSKRNRNIEGTGLGLAISKQFLSLMGGDIKVESEYGSGSTFSFNIPQKVSVARPSIEVQKNKNDITIVSYVKNQYVKEQLKKDINRLGVKYLEADSEKKLKNYFLQGVQFVFIDSRDFTKNIENMVKENKEITAVLMTPFYETPEYDIDNILVVKKPLYSLNIAMILNHEDLHNSYNEDDNQSFSFTAPDAEVLIVDDNAINLTVAIGLLEPLNMKIDKAVSGKEAIDKVGMKKYDLILMDHMMPEIDGIEATHIIRRFYENYKDVPIIALTANAVEGTKELFLKEGMNDFVAKPIEIRELVSKLNMWLPQEKIKKISAKRETENKKEEEPDFQVEGLDMDSALALLGSKKLYLAVLKDYYHAINRKEKLIRNLVETKDWKNYTVEVHALKSASRQIGASELAKKAEEMEKAGNALDLDAIQKNTEPMLTMYHHYEELLSNLFQEEQKQNHNQIPITKEVLNEEFSKLQTALDDLDMDEMESVINILSGYDYPDDYQKKLFEQLKVAIDNLDVESCALIIQDWKSIL